MGPPQRCVVVVVIVTTARILRSRYRNENEEGCSAMCRMRRGGRRQSQDVQIMYARQVLQCNVSSVKGIIGRRTKSNAKDVLSSYATRPCSRTLQDCPICFLPMPLKIISCVTLPDATITSMPIRDFAMANEELEKSIQKNITTNLWEKHF